MGTYVWRKVHSYRLLYCKGISGEILALKECIIDIFAILDQYTSIYIRLKD